MGRASAAGLLAMILLTASLARAAVAQEAPKPAARQAEIDDGVRVLLEGTRLVAMASARDGEDWESLAARVLLDPAKGPALEAESRNGAAADQPRDGALAAGREVNLPVRLWPAGFGARALLALFPQDSVGSEGWRHVVTPGATSWSLAVLFIGSGARHAEMRSASGGPVTCRAGDVVVVPFASLRPELRANGVAVSSAPSSPGAPSAGGPAPSGGTVIRGSGGLSESGRGTLELIEDLAKQVLAAARATEASTAPAAAESTEPPLAETTEPALGGTTVPDLEPGEDDGPEAPPPLAQESSTLIEECAAIDGEEPVSEPEPPPGTEEPFVIPRGAHSPDGVLRYATDAEGPHAVYRLKRGETLYSNVVLRFTGLLGGTEVNAAAQRLARRSGITDVTNIAVGAAIRIPLSELLPQYLPTGHPRRERWEQERQESTRLARRERRRNLEGVHVLIDAGHGGSDPGAGNAVVWEDDHAYDIACRMIAILADRTQATAHPLIRDRSSGHAPLARLRRDSDEELLTTPPMKLSNVPTRVAVNTRWLLANDMRRRLAAEGVADERIVFISIHADSLHESATGSMAYFPSARLRAPSCGVPQEAPYLAIKESREENAFKMSRREALRAEGLSRDLGEALIGSIRSATLPVHGYSPVRGSIQRNTLMVPAVLKYNRVPAAVLLEAGNLNNPRDQRSLRDPVFRQDLADALVKGLITYFAGQESGPQKAGGR